LKIAFIVDLPIKNGVFPELPEGNRCFYSVRNRIIPWGWDYNGGDISVPGGRKPKKNSW
jgi:hypothetical protein